MADFTVVIPAYKEGEQLLRTMLAVGSCLEGQYTPEVIVVDDCSEDNTYEIAEKGARQLQADGISAMTVRAPRRSGVAGAKNVGQEHATTPVTFFLDAHSVPGRGSLERVVAPLLNREAAIVGPTFVTLPQLTTEERLTGKINEIPPEEYDLPNVIDTIEANSVGYGRGMVIRDTSFSLEWMAFRAQDEGLQRVMVVPGGCCGVRTDEHGPNVFDDGLFDTGFSFPWGAEDAELSLRAWRLGQVVASVPRAFIATEFRTTFRYGTAACHRMYNALRMAAIFFSPDLFEDMARHHIGQPDFLWVVGQLLYRSNVAERRKRLDELGPDHMRDLLPVLFEFGGLNAATGTDRRLIHFEDSAGS